MKVLVATVLLVGALVVPASAAASTSSIRNCGEAGYAIHNVTTRDTLSCRSARKGARTAGFIEYGEYSFRHPSDDRYRCRVRIPDRRSYRVDVRCTSWIYVFRFQYDSGE